MKIMEMTDFLNTLKKRAVLNDDEIQVFKSDKLKQKSNNQYIK